MAEKILFLGQIFKMEILMDSHFLMVPVSENHIFSGWSVCLLSAYLKKKKNIEKTTKFGILYLYNMLLKTFYENQTKCLYRDTQKNSIRLWPIDRISHL